LAALKEKGFNPRQMSSFTETDATEFFFKNYKFFKPYHQVN